MKKAMKKTVSTLLAFAILLTWILFAPQAGTTAEAAASYYLPSSYRNMTFFCVPDDLPATYVTLKVYKKGTFQKPKASYIKNIGSSDRSVARPYIDKAGDIRVYFFKKNRNRYNFLPNRQADPEIQNHYKRIHQPLK